MMQTSHAASGALIGSLMPDPVSAFAAGVAAHFVLDKVPHYWPESRRAKTMMILLDHALTYTAFALAVYFRVGDPRIWAGVAGSLIVDIVLVGIPAAYRSRVGHWHRSRQPHQTAPIAFVSDVAVTLGCAVLLAVR